MIYELKQYSCDNCGNLSEVLDPDAPLPDGWVSLSRFTHYCPRCAKSNIKYQKNYKTYE